jgi:hypothetical protein
MSNTNPTRTRPLPRALAPSPASLPSSTVVFGRDREGKNVAAIAVIASIATMRVEESVTAPEAWRRPR